MNFIYKNKELIRVREIRNALHSISGLGWLKSIKVCSKLGLSYPLSCGNLNAYNYFILSKLLDHFTLVDIRIQRYLTQNILALFNIQCYKGVRHKDRLPVRGQRTRTNASTKKRIFLKFLSIKKDGS